MKHTRRYNDKIDILTQDKIIDDFVWGKIAQKLLRDKVSVTIAVNEDMLCCDMSFKNGEYTYYVFDAKSADQRPLHFIGIDGMMMGVGEA